MSISIRSAYRWIKRFKLHLGHIRSHLVREKPPPEQSDITLETITLQLLNEVFPEDTCSVSAFQNFFQVPFLP